MWAGVVYTVEHRARKTWQFSMWAGVVYTEEHRAGKTWQFACGQGFYTRRSIGPGKPHNLHGQPDHLHVTWFYTRRTIGPGTPGNLHVSRGCVHGGASGRENLAMCMCARVVYTEEHRNDGNDGFPI
eukprot:gene7974-biopygen21107